MYYFRYSYTKNFIVKNKIFKPSKIPLKCSGCIKTYVLLFFWEFLNKEVYKTTVFSKIDNISITDPLGYR